MKKEVIEWIISIIIAIAIVFLINKFIISSYSVSGLSMHPTFNDGDRVIVSKVSKELNHLDHRDIIVFHENENADYIKRLIGRPGDTIRYQSDQLYINNKKIEEPYLNYNKKHKFGKLLTENFKNSDIYGGNNKAKIPKNHYLVLGDNRQNSQDSRSPEVGLINEKQIVGKVILTYWPLRGMKINF